MKRLDLGARSVLRPGSCFWWLSAGLPADTQAGGVQGVEECEDGAVIGRVEVGVFLRPLEEPGDLGRRLLRHR